MNENRMRINREMIAIENRIKRWFAIYFPEYKNVFGNWDCDSSIEVLINAPLPADAVMPVPTPIMRCNCTSCLIHGLIIICQNIDKS